MGEPFHVWLLHGDDLVDDPARRVGMGFVIGDRHILTCAHVVAGAIHPGKTEADAARRSAVASSPETPPQTIVVGFPYSEEAGERAYAATVVGWARRQSPDQRALPDDVALLRLDGPLPSDVRAGPLLDCGFRIGDSFYGMGISALLREGQPFNGDYSGTVPGRATLRSNNIDATVREGYSGAALYPQDAEAIYGMVTSAQAAASALFISARELLKLGFVSEVAQSSSFLALAGSARPSNSTSALVTELRKTSVGARLRRRFYALDHVEACQRILGLAVDSPAPMIALCGGLNDDMAHCLHQRLQMSFRLRAERARAAQSPLRATPFPPLDLPDLKLIWPEPDRRERRLSMLKGQLSEKLQVGGDGRGPKVIRAALRHTAMCVYSEIRLTADGVDRDDQALLRDWAAYLAEVGAVGLKKALVHVICVLPADGAQAPDAPAFTTLITDLAERASRKVVLDQKLLRPLVPDMVTEWLQLHGPADLEADELAAFSERVTDFLDSLARANPQQSIRLGHIERWLSAQR